MAKSEEPKRCHFHHSLSLNSCESVTIMEGDVSSDNGAILESMGRVLWQTSLATVMHAGLPKMLASSGYKSQRRSRTKKKEEKTRGGGGTKRERQRKVRKQRGKNRKKKKTRQRGKRRTKGGGSRTAGRTRQQRKTEGREERLQ